MAKKITDLTALTLPASGDLLAIVDVSEALPVNQTKKITHDHLLAAVNALITANANNIAALKAPPKVRVVVTTDFSSGTSIADVSWQTEVFDTNSLFDSGSPTRITFTTAGLYMITFQVIWSSGTAGSYRHAGLYLGGSTSSPIGTTTVSGAGVVTPLIVSALYQFTAGQYLTAKLQSGESENVTDCMLTAVKVSD